MIISLHNDGYRGRSVVWVELPGNFPSRASCQARFETYQAYWSCSLSSMQQCSPISHQHSGFLQTTTVLKNYQSSATYSFVLQLVYMYVCYVLQGGF